MGWIGTRSLREDHSRKFVSAFSSHIELENEVATDKHRRRCGKYEDDIKPYAVFTERCTE